MTPLAAHPPHPKVDLLTLLLRSPAADPDACATTQLGGGLPCQREDPELWFAQQPILLEQAKRFCGECPLRRECLQGAIGRQEPWGVWGGEIVERGEIVRNKRSRGRPRKQAHATKITF